MSPKLRERILLSLHSDARSRAGGASPIQGARLIRVLISVGVVGLSVALFVSFKKSREEFARAHTALLTRYEAERRSYDESYKSRLAFIDNFLKDIPQEPPPDLVREPLGGGSEALTDLLQAPFVYVRGPINGFKRRAERRATWTDGGPDALVRCLLMPPESTKESALLRHLGKIYEPRAFAGRFVNVDDAFRAQEFIDSDFGVRLKKTSLMRELSGLEATLDTAPLKSGRAFSSVRHFFYVFDEPKTKGAVSDFDGEAEHYLRLGIVDLLSNETVYRVRRRVDPEWLSEKTRLSYSRPLDSCKLATELLTELESPK